MQHYTTIEQSKKLIELGLNPDTADMIIVNGICYPKEEGYTDIENTIPSWSLGALLEVMPKEDVKPFEDSNPFIGYGDGLYRCAYLNGDWESSHQTIGGSLIEAAYNMVVWLLENGYIKTEKK